MTDLVPRLGRRAPTRALFLLLAPLAAACGSDADLESPGPLADDAALYDDVAPDDDAGTSVDAPAADAGAKQDSAAAPDTRAAPESGVDAVAEVAPGDAATGCALPARDCVGTAAHCMELISFEPKLGPGYEDYPLNGETSANQYRSFARRDLVMLVQYAAAYVECRGKSFTPGNGKPLGLGDMSERDGSIPGTSVGSPGHPAGTHTNGNDMDIGYYQTVVDNRLRPICPHTTGGAEQYHCTGAPTVLDVKRTAMFLGAFLTSPLVRVIGVDGQVGPLVVSELQRQCDAGLLPKSSCDRKGFLTYEVTDEGRGWFTFHHHHFHVSLKRVTGSTAGVLPLAGELRLDEGGLGLELDRLREARVPGLVRTLDEGRAD